MNGDQVLKRNRIPIGGGVTLLVLMLAGCGQGLSQKAVDLRNRIFVEEEPPGAITIEQARELATEGEEVTLIVKVGNPNFPKWSSDDQVLFYVSEGYPDSDYNVGPDHDPSTCPFCKWKWKDEDSLAIVSVVDEQGAIVAGSAEELLGLTVGETLVVNGFAEVDETGFLQLQAAKIFRKGTS